ncbi:MAG TPA: DMT family transporter [Rhodopila sp.]|uniref:DMT family transporter n=1 Tax=Rhodopila sp. TaxID=2480087 RepID=UPI002CF132FF|nr:DMT family transporter [Rhodopila sp.]HVY13843.1 DMT family transporter [Rhodopila sp.]
MFTTRQRCARDRVVLDGPAAGKLTGAACVVLTAIGWGLNWPATKVLIETFPPLSARGVTGLVASVVLFAVALLRREGVRVTRRELPHLAWGAVLNVTVWMGGTTASLQWLRAGQAATLAYTMPIWVCLLAWPILAQRPTPRQMGAIFLGICGVLVLCGPESMAFSGREGPGIALALLAAFLFALGTVSGKAHPLSLTPLALTAWQVGLGSVPLAVLGFATEHPDFSRLSVPGWATLGYTALVSMGLCYLTWFIAKGRLSALAAAMGTLLTPVVGVGASAIFLGDALTIHQLVALALVSSGIVLAVGIPQPAP